MDLIIRPNSPLPIYEQICEGIRALVRNGKLKENDQLPSVRAFSREYKISALTVKKAYDQLEQEGLIVTIRGKGSYIGPVFAQMLQEEKQRQIEGQFQSAIEAAKAAGFTNDEIQSIVKLLLEEKV